MNTWDFIRGFVFGQFLLLALLLFLVQLLFLKGPFDLRRSRARKQQQQQQQQAIKQNSVNAINDKTLKKSVTEHSIYSQILDEDSINGLSTGGDQLLSQSSQSVSDRIKEATLFLQEIGYDLSKVESAEWLHAIISFMIKSASKSDKLRNQVRSRILQVFNGANDSGGQQQQQQQQSSFISKVLQSPRIYQLRLFYPLSDQLHQQQQQQQQSNIGDSIDTQATPITPGLKTFQFESEDAARKSTVSNVQIRTSPEGYLSLVFDLSLRNVIQLQFDTCLLLNWPMDRFAGLPLTLNLQLERLDATVCIAFVTRSEDNSTVTLQLRLLPEFIIDLQVKSLLGEKTKLKDLPRIQDLIRAALYDYIDDHFVRQSMTISSIDFYTDCMASS
ncbi:hypothetical protein MP228_010848 [Amoeboaphelidium protococcarum]|nr:hypothetical protein MP228_010848 [Amoeboaphelidium protococcarum]